ncbi:MAG TPA: VOC family protein [Ktedonobacteraceae bacterium]|nr:VOC family protein [Ktedonobacteraceae bacterium]
MAQGFEGSALARPVLHHVNLKTTRLQEMIDWYATTVGLAPVFQFPGGAWLSNDAANHRLALLTSSKMSDDADKVVHTGIHHLAFEYATLDELLTTYTHLKELGIKPHMCLDHGMTLSFYYVDPDGNSVELQVDNFGNWIQSTAWMHTSPDFAADPIGQFVDPDQIIAARKAGASFADIHRRAYAGEFPPSGPIDPRVPLDDPRSPL